MKKVLKITFTLFGALGIGLILLVVTHLLSIPQIDVTASAPRISEERAEQIGYDAQEALSCVKECELSPDGRYEIEYEQVDDRGWIEKLINSGYAHNGLTKITIVDKTSEEPPKEAAVLQESDPGSGRSYNVFWSPGSQYVTISGMVRVDGDGNDRKVQQIRYIFAVDEEKLYSR